MPRNIVTLGHGRYYCDPPVPFVVRVTRGDFEEMTDYTEEVHHTAMFVAVCEATPDCWVANPVVPPDAIDGDGIWVHHEDVEVTEAPNKWQLLELLRRL